MLKLLIIAYLISIKGLYIVISGFVSGKQNDLFNVRVQFEEVVGAFKKMSILLMMILPIFTQINLELIQNGCYGEG